MKRLVTLDSGVAWSHRSPEVDVEKPSKMRAEFGHARPTAGARVWSGGDEMGGLVQEIKVKKPSTARKQEILTHSFPKPGLANEEMVDRRALKAKGEKQHQGTISHQ